jgi:hypothetical protein
MGKGTSITLNALAKCIRNRRYTIAGDIPPDLSRNLGENGEEKAGLTFEALCTECLQLLARDESHTRVGNASHHTSAFVLCPLS